MAAGARIINLSLALVRPSSNTDRALTSALDLAMLRGILIVAAAGNQTPMMRCCICDEYGGGCVCRTARGPILIPRMGEPTD
jgi:Subtilase family